jgi:hypothetical protein
MFLHLVPIFAVEMENVMEVEFANACQDSQNQTVQLDLQ